MRMPAVPFILGGQQQDGKQRNDAKSSSATSCKALVNLGEGKVAKHKTKNIDGKGFKIL